MRYDHPEQLRQALLELHYELLDDSEAQELWDAIESDPKVAAEWASIQGLAERIADAASLRRLELPDPLIHADRGLAQDRPSQSVVVEPVAARRVWSWATSASVAALAAMLGMLLIGSWYFARIPQTPAAVIRLQAVRVPRPLAKSDHEFRVFTSRIDRASAAGGFPVTPASLSFSVLAREAVLFSGTARTDEAGSTSITLPQVLVIPPDARLQVTASSAQGAAKSSSIEVPLEPTRCATYLTIDRPVYRPGETVFFRSLTLLRQSLNASSEFPIRFELLGPDGTMVSGAFLEGVTEHGVGNGSFVIPTSAAAGSYTLLAKSLDGFFPEQRYAFQVRAYRVPRFKKTLRFLRRGYAPGDNVEAVFSASRITGDALADAAVEVVATAGDREIYQSTLATSSTGTCEIAFQLPTTGELGAVQLAITVGDQQTSETEIADVPMQIGQVSVHFYPEGGFLVDGLENRVYFTAHDVSGAPIHLEGELLDRAGNRIAEVATIRDGMGSFSIQPAADESYRLRVLRPTETQTTFQLPEVVEDLPVMDTGSGVFAAGEPITMVVRVARSRSILVRLACRGQFVGERRFSLVPGANRVELRVPPDVGGVVRVTILDPEARPVRPLVERLVYRRPSRRLQIEVVDEPNALRRSPGDSLSLTLQARDENGDPIAAVLGVSVVDDAVWSLDKHDRPSLDTQFLLLSEIKSPEQLEHADFYLGDDPDAAHSLDLLLGTQGWRRFVSPGATDVQPDFRQQLIRLLELDGNSSTASQRFDNSSVVASEWFRYQQARDQAWQRLLVEARVLAFLVVAIWFAAFLIHRRGARKKLAICLLMGSSSLLMYGCGASPDAMVVQSPAQQATSSGVDSVRVSPNRAGNAVAPMQATTAASRDDNAGDSAIQAPPQLVDWLDEAKAAWLLRVARQTETSQSNAQQTGVTSADKRLPGHPPITAEELRRLMVSRGLNPEGLADELLHELRFPIRQFAHQRAKTQAEQPRDWSETLYWQPLLITDEQGRATIQFDLPDTATAFRIQIDGHTEGGRIGSGNASIVTTD